MAEYAVTFARSARRELEALEPAVVNRIFPRIEALSHDPRPQQCLKLRGRRGLWRMRVGDYRIVYAVDDQGRTVDIIAVRHRRDAYR